ncbi:MAG: hypothetical protein QGG40_06585 [Myxococcota bacterium]|jgi:hypothetical protein|nr:hypothetical protein [Myxococcota bacterium]
MFWTFFLGAALAQQTRTEFVATCDKQLTPLLSWSAEAGVQWLPGEPDPDVAEANREAMVGRGGWSRVGDRERGLGGLRMSAVQHPSFHPTRLSSFAHTWTAYSSRRCRPDEAWTTQGEILLQPQVREALAAWQEGTVPGQTWIAQDTLLYSAPSGDEAVAFLLRGERVQVTGTEPGRSKVAANLRGQLVQGWAPVERLTTEETAPTRTEPSEHEQTWIAACEYDRATLVARWTAEGGLEAVGGEAWPAERLGELGRELSRRHWTFHPTHGTSERSAFAAPGVVKVDESSMLDLGRCPGSGIVTTGASLAAGPLSGAPSIVVDLEEKQDFYLPYPTRQQCGPIAVQEDQTLNELSEMGCEPTWTTIDSQGRGLLSFIETRDGTTWTAVITELNGDHLVSSIRVDVRWRPGG